MACFIHLKTLLSLPLSSFGVILLSRVGWQNDPMSGLVLRANPPSSSKMPPMGPPTLLHVFTTLGQGSGPSHREGPLRHMCKLRFPFCLPPQDERECLSYRVRGGGHCQRRRGRAGQGLPSVGTNGLSLPGRARRHRTEGAWQLYVQGHQQ